MRTRDPSHRDPAPPSPRRPPRAAAAAVPSPLAPAPPPSNSCRLHSTLRAAAATTTHSAAAAAGRWLRSEAKKPPGPARRRQRRPSRPSPPTGAAARIAAGRRSSCAWAPAELPRAAPRFGVCRVTWSSLQVVGWCRPECPCAVCACTSLLLAGWRSPAGGSGGGAQELERLSNEALAERCVTAALSTATSQHPCEPNTPTPRLFNTARQRHLARRP